MLIFSSYTPSVSLTIIAISLFGVLLVILLVRVCQSHLWSYLPLLIGCVVEIVGYSLRYMSAHVDPYRITFFIIQYFCITVAPVFIAASVYMYLSSLTTWASAKGLQTGWPSKLGRRTMLWIFITADVLCTLLQVTGAALIGAKTSKHKDPSTANNVLVGGLAAQTLAFSVFLLLLVSLISSMRKNKAALDIQSSQTVKKCTFSLSLSGLFIMLRTIFRQCESAQGVFGYLSSQETFFGTLEFAPVVIACSVLTLWTPALLSPRRFVSDTFPAHPKDASEYQICD